MNKKKYAYAKASSGQKLWETMRFFKSGKVLMLWLARCSCYKRKFIALLFGLIFFKYKY